jgi:hypothetical protein
MTRGCRNGKPRQYVSTQADCLDNTCTTIVCLLHYASLLDGTVRMVELCSCSADPRLADDVLPRTDGRGGVRAPHGRAPDPQEQVAPGTPIRQSLTLVTWPVLKGTPPEFSHTSDLASTHHPQYATALPVDAVEHADCAVLCPSASDELDGDRRRARVHREEGAADRPPLGACARNPCALVRRPQPSARTSVL